MLSAQKSIPSNFASRQSFSSQEMAGEKIKHASREGVYRLRCRADGVEIVLTYATFLDGRHQQAGNGDCTSGHRKETPGHRTNTL